jgi:hypothetical protein
MPACRQRSASQYHVKMHSTATTTSSRNGAMSVRKCSGGGRAVAVDTDIPLRVEHAHVHVPGVEVDAAIVLVLLRVESHQVSSLSPVGGRLRGRTLLTLPDRQGGGLNENQRHAADGAPRRR